MNFEQPRGLRQSMSWLHTWSGLTLGWLLFAIFVMGSLSFYRNEISLWMQPELHQARENPEAITTALATLERIAPNAQQWTITPPNDRNALVSLSWQEPVTAKPGREGRANASNPANSRQQSNPAESRNRQGGGGGGRNQEGFKRAIMDPATGELLKPRETAGGNFLYRFHFELYGLDRLWARWIVGVATFFMFVAIIAGVVIHRNIFRDFFTFRRGKGQRSWLDSHDASAVLALPFHIVITFSGLVLLSAQLMPSAADVAYKGDPRAFTQELRGGGNRRGEAPPKPQGVPAPLTDLSPLLQTAHNQWPEGIGSITINNPGDAFATIELRQLRGSTLANRGATESLRFNGTTGEQLDTVASRQPSVAIAIWNTVSAVHMGRFAAPLPRLLLFISGILGCLMVASGLVMWLVARAKTREKSIARNGRMPLGHRLVEVLNVAAIAGLLLSIAAYFWANRLLPVDLGNRGQQEILTFFLVWLACLLHALIRPYKSAWVEQLGIAGLLTLLLPLLNGLTGGAHLGISLSNGQWQVAGFDIWALVLASGLLFSAYKVLHYTPRLVAKKTAARTANYADKPTPELTLTTEEAR